jgi:hypothetical protein
MKQRPVPSSIEYKLLQIVLHKPEWAGRLPLELIDRERVEGDALHAIANAIEHGELPAGGFGMLLEFFRATPHEALIAAIAANMTEEVDLAALEGVFNDSIVRLRHTAITAEIEQLTARARQGLNQDRAATACGTAGEEASVVPPRRAAARCDIIPGSSALSRYADPTRPRACCVARAVRVAPSIALQPRIVMPKEIAKHSKSRAAAKPVAKKPAPAKKSGDGEKACSGQNSDEGSGQSPDQGSDKSPDQGSGQSSGQGLGKSSGQGLGKSSRQGSGRDRERQKQQKLRLRKPSRR